MSFSKTGPNSAASELCEVKIAKRDQLHYIQSGEITIIPIEIDIDRVILIGIGGIPSSTRFEVRKQIGDALKFLGIPHRFDM